MDARTLLVAAAAMVAGACAAVSVKSDYDRDISFDRLQTYDWMETAEETREEFEAVSPFLERRLERSVDDALVHHGYQRQTEGEVDFLVTAFVVTPPVVEGEDRRSYSPRRRVSVGIGIGFGSWGYPYYGRRHFGYPYFGFPYGYRYGGYPYLWSPYVGYPFAFSYPFAFGVGYSPYYSSAEYMTAEGHMPGTLVIDVLDSEGGDLIWRGWADRALAFAPEDPEELPAFIDHTVRKIMATFPPDAH